MRKNYFQNVKEGKRKVTTLCLFGLMCMPMMAQTQPLQINVNDAQFTHQMVEGLIKEYHRRS